MDLLNGDTNLARLILDEVESQHIVLEGDSLGAAGARGVAFHLWNNRVWHAERRGRGYSRGGGQGQFVPGYMQAFVVALTLASRPAFRRVVPSN